MKKKLSLNQKHWLSLISAYLLSMGVPIVTAVIAFPPEITQGTNVSVGMTLILTAIISVSVFRKQIKATMQTASVLGTWVVMLVICIIAKFFVDQMLVISLVGTASNAGSVPLFKIADSTGATIAAIKEEKKKQQVAAEVANERKV
jgi:hypothetical protein